MKESDNMFEDDERTIDDIIKKISARRGIWLDSEKEFREKVFERNCKYLESLGVDPIDDPQTLKICMKTDYTALFDFIKDFYEENTECYFISWKSNN